MNCIKGTCHLGEVIDRAEPDEYSLISPERRHEEGPLVPHSADVVPEGS